MINKTITINEKMILDADMSMAYDAMKTQYECSDVYKDLRYSFDEYLLRCGLTTLLKAFEAKLLEAKLPEGHA